MVARALWTSILVVGLLAVGGIGFAAFTATYQVNIQGTAGNLSIAVANYNTQVSNAYVGCVGSISGTYLNITAGPFAPGDWCQVYGNITNTGNVPANVFANWPHSGIDACFVWTVIYPTHNPYVPPTGRGLAPGGMEKFQFALGLNVSAGNSCENDVATVTMDFTATSLAPSMPFP
ncbi:MAG: hypothetical protein WB809_07625 [Thermoplasmata archaeon]